MADSLPQPDESSPQPTVASKLPDNFVASLDLSDRIRLAAQLISLKTPIGDVLLKQAKREQIKGAKPSPTDAYYTQKAASKVKPALDKLSSDGKPLLIPFQAFGGLARQSCRQFVRSAWRWLRHHDINKEKYNELFSRHQVSLTKTGVCITAVDMVFANTGDDVPLLFKEFDPNEQDWRQDLDEWMDRSLPGSPPFIKTDLKLDEQEQADLRHELSVAGIVAIITSGSVKVMRLTAEQQQALSGGEST